MKKTFFIYLLFPALFSCKNQPEAIDIQWSTLDGDYSFTQKWDYPEGISTNAYGQLICEGLCDEASYRMIDENGKIYADSITRYYQIVDTTHLHHSILSDAQVYEYGGTNFVNAFRENDTIRCYTLCNAATHSSLQLVIADNKCIAQVILNSIASAEPKTYKCTGGYIKIDSTDLQKDYLKAEFNFVFENPDKGGIGMWWKGIIYTKVENKIYN